MDNNQVYLDIMQIVCDEICQFSHSKDLEQAELEAKCEECLLAKKVNSTLTQFSTERV